MKVTFLRNNYENVNVSMKIYADDLETALKSSNIVIDLHDIAPFSTIGNALTAKSGFLGRFRNYWERFFLYPKLLNQLSSDIFHIIDHSFSYLLKYVDPSKTVVTCHDLILLKTALGHFEGQTPPRFANYLFEKSVRQMGKACKIIAVSENTKNDIVKLLGIESGRIEIIHHGIDKEFFSPAVERNNCHGYRILHVGGHLFYKNLSGVISAINSLDPKIKVNTTLVKVGGSNSNLSDNIEFHNKVSRERLPDIYRSCDLLLFPSLYEGFGIPPLEAMACGIPVVVSDRGSLPEICGDAAVYVDPLNPKMMAEAVEAVLTDPILRDKLIAKGLERVKQFDWSITARKTYDLYQLILKK
jgi:glycosyltransferase involved in cell wall biosynthesis